MKKGSISLDEYMKATKRLEKMLLEANELLRSAYAIAQRNGEETNWEAFRGQLKKALDAQHESGLTPRTLDGVTVCRQVNHFYVDGVCAECGSVEPPASNANRWAARGSTR
jgi:hypothetical protein